MSDCGAGVCVCAPNGILPVGSSMLCVRAVATLAELAGLGREDGVQYHGSMRRVIRRQQQIGDSKGTTLFCFLHRVSYPR
jgi:hypothetical protein